MSCTNCASVEHGAGDLGPTAEVVRITGYVLDVDIRNYPRGHAGLALDDAFCDLIPPADDGEGIEHLVGDGRRHPVHVARLEPVVELGRHPLEAEVVELERIVFGRAIESDLSPGPVDKERPLLG